MKIFFLLAQLLVCCAAWGADDRFVSLSPALTEWVYAFGVEDQLVGVTQQCDFPVAAQKVAKIGGFATPSLETILSKKPTLVLASQGNAVSTLDALKKRGIPVFMAESSTMKELQAEVTQLGDVFKKQHVANDWNAKLTLKLMRLSASTQVRSALILLQLNPYYSVSSTTWLGRMFAAAGFKNSIEAPNPQYPVLTEEFVRRSHPAFVFLDSGIDATAFKKNVPLSNQKIITLPKDIFMRPGPRLLNALDSLYEYQKL